MENFEYSIEESDEGNIINFSGHIGSDFSKCFGDIENKTGKECIFNLSGVSGVDQEGAESWWDVFTRLSKIKTSIKFEEVNYILLNQTCLNPEFLSFGEITSFFLDLECESCDSITSMRFTDPDTAEAALNESGLFACDKCRGPLDVIVDAFPVFLDLLRAR